jgi:excisionase family DNA binding protein
MQALFTIEQKAEFLGLSAWTIRYMIRRGTLPSVKIGRRILVERGELEKLIQNGSPPKARVPTGCYGPQL